jgi:neutral amino acid transport system ATP-binding protein
VVMGQGQVIAEGPASHVMADSVVIDAYLGARHDQPLDPRAADGADQR